MTLTRTEIKELNKKYKNNLTELRLDINVLESRVNRTQEEDEQLTKLMYYRTNYVGKYINEAYVNLLKEDILD